MTKLKKRLIVLFTVLTCLGISSTSMAANIDMNEIMTEETIHRVSYVIYDVNGNVKSEGELPMTEEDAMIQPRISYPSKTLNAGECMYLYGTEGFPFFLTAGSRLNMNFGLNRNAVMTASIIQEPNVVLSTGRGITSGRSLNAIVQKTGNHHGFIRNDDGSPVTVNYANFTTAY